MELRFPADRICIVLLTGLGDVVHGFPVVNALKDDDPNRRITWVVEPMPSAILRPHPSVDEVVVFQKARGWRGLRDLWRELRHRSFDLTLNLNIYFKSVFPTLFSRAPHRLGFDPARSRDAVWFFSNHRLPPRPRAHTQDMFLEFLDFLGLRSYRVDWRIQITDGERALQSEFFAPLQGRPTVAVVAASANPAKDWRPERYAQVIDTLESDLGFRVMLVGGPGARETRIAREVESRCRTRPVWALGDGVRRLVWLIDGSQLVLAPDTGPLHIAHALNVPVIGLYGHTNPWRVGPYCRFRDLCIDRYTREDEEPDPRRIEPRLGRMELITVDDVLERVELALTRYPRSTGERA